MYNITLGIVFISFVTLAGIFLDYFLWKHDRQVDFIEKELYKNLYLENNNPIDTPLRLPTKSHKSH